MKKGIIYFLVSLLLLIPDSLAAKGDDELKYDIVSAGVSESGMTLVRVSVYVSKTKNATDELFKKAAVHGIIFRGVSGSGVTGYSKQSALVTSAGAAQQYGDYFDTFFTDNGEYISYANVVQSTTETVKVGKEYRVSAVVNVSSDALKSTLKAAGVIKGMTAGF